MSKNTNVEFKSTNTVIFLNYCDAISNLFFGSVQHIYTDQASIVGTNAETTKIWHLLQTYSHAPR